MSNEKNEIINIYKSDEWTACIVTNDQGEVLDCTVTPRPMSEFDRRMRERERTPRYLKNKRTLQARTFDENSLAVEE